jgi:outer membrane protein assembly factor BamB
MIRIVPLLLCSTLALADDEPWAEFRGPSGTGHSTAQGLPKEWSETQNVVWQTPVRGLGWSSPVVWGKQVWLTSATPDGKELYVLCIDKEKGKPVLDTKLFDIAKPEDTAKFNSFASPTPAIEEGRVYIHFGSYGTACLDTKTGKPLWIRQDIPCNHWRGPGSSPILWRNLLIVNYDGYDHQFVVALDKSTGKTVWKTDRSHVYGTDDGDQKKGYGTCVVAELEGKPVLLSPAAKGMHALDPATGKELWHVRFPGHSTGARPLVGHGWVYLSTGFPKSELLAIRPGGSGDVTASAVVWKASKGVGSKPSPVLVDDLIYSLQDNGVLSCFDAKTGAEIYQQRILKNCSASLLFADGAIYCFGEDGGTVLVAPGREFKEIGKGKLDSGGRTMGTPAISGKALFIRTATHLYRIEAK